MILCVAFRVFIIIVVCYVIESVRERFGYTLVLSELYAFLTSALPGSEWSASEPHRLTPKERGNGIHWAPEPVLEEVEREKILLYS
jgi:hypothetical protein